MTTSGTDRRRADAQLAGLLETTASEIEELLADDQNWSGSHAMTRFVARVRELVPCMTVGLAVQARVGFLDTVVDGDSYDIADLLDRTRAEVVTRPRADTSVEELPAVDGLPSVLLAPVVIRNRNDGVLCLVGPQPGPRFTADALELAQGIAEVAATAIERGRTLAANRNREEWYAAGAELAKEIVSGRVDEPLVLIADRVAQLAQADFAAVLELGDAEDTLVVAAVSAGGRPEWVGRAIVAPDSLTSRVLATGKPMTAGAPPLPEGFGGMPLGAVSIVPLMGSGGQQGAIVISGRPEQPPLSNAEIGMATMFAETATLALELAESQERRDELALVEERDRIARDLHDHVIQRLYAIGLSMQSVANAISDGPADRLMGSVDEIDETIKQIRSTIFQLTTPILSSERSLRARAESLLGDLERALGFRPRFITTGPVDFGVDDTVIEDCVAVLREAVTNIARHARATEAEVAISVSPAQLRIEVRDNGRGLGDSTRRSGLANLRARAEKHGGFMQVRSSGSDGTWLLWSIPLLAVD